MNVKRNKHENPAKSLANFAEIIATVAAMARCLNQNLAKVHVAPLDSKLTGNGIIDYAKLSAVDSQS